MSDVSASDLQLFGALSNPSATRPISDNVDELNLNQGVLDRSSQLHDIDEQSLASRAPSIDMEEAHLPSESPKSVASSYHARSVTSHASSSASVFARQVEENLVHETSRRSFTPIQSENIFGSLKTNTQELSESGDDLLAKQQALLELERLRRQGVTLTRQYTVRDRIEDIEFEVKRHCMHIEEETTLNFMRDSMKIAFGAIELANNKLGPWLDLDGWSSQMTSDMSKYDPALTRIYRKYCKKSSMSPEAEIVLGVVSSIGMHHCRRKFTQTMATDMGFMPPKMPPHVAMDTVQEDDVEAPPPFDQSG